MHLLLEEAGEAIAKEWKSDEEFSSSPVAPWSEEQGKDHEGNLELR